MTFSHPLLTTRRRHQRGYYDTEPLPPGSVFSGAVPNLLLTPHIAGGTVESTERRGTIVARRVAEHLAAGGA